MNLLLRAPLVGLLAILSSAAHAQTAFQISDIDPALPGIGTSSSPRSLTVLAGKIIFSAEEPSSGRELWVTDGTPAGTELLFDICPGACSSEPVILGTLGQRLLFFGDSSGRLWRTDGTRAGTFHLGVRASRLAFLQGIAYFPYCDGEYCQVWRTDGTIGGTRSVAGSWRPQVDAVVQGPFVTGSKLFWLLRRSAWPEAEIDLWTSDGTGDGTSRITLWLLKSVPRLAAAAGGRLFFLASDPAEGEELWTSDGTAAGTRALTRFVLPRPFDANVVLKAGAGGIYFAADDGTHGVDIWRSDGTTAGTQRVTALAPAQPFLPFLDPAWIEEAGGRLLVIAGDAASGYRLFTSSGAPASTASLGALAVSPFTGLLRVGGRVFFRADDGPHGYELWSTNGTKAGTALALDICPGLCDSQLSRPLALGTGVAFLASDMVHGPQVWTSDGTAAGTRARTDVPRGTLWAQTFEVAVLGQSLFFLGEDRHGEELWISGADAGGGRRVTEVAATGSSSAPRDLTPVGDRLVFSACDGRSRELWGTDGTPGGHVRLTDFQVPDSCEYRDSYSSQLKLASGGMASGVAFFWHQADDHTWKLWRTDGTLREAPGGTREIAAFGTEPSQMIVHAGTAFFFVHPSYGEVEVWRSDGTAAGTRKLLDLPPAEPGSGGSGMTWFGQSLYLGLPQGLYRNDGVTADLDLVSDKIESSPWHFTQADGLLYFFAWSQDYHEVLWRTDGSPGGTYPVASFPQLKNVEMIEAGGKLYILLSTYGSGSGDDSELWASDGTPEGTTRLVQMAGASAGNLLVAAGRLFFTAADAVHGRELWTSDGTAGGTVLVRDLYPGPASSDPSGLTAFGVRLFFAASDGVHGRELWQSDGSLTGTRLAQDLAPGGLSSAPDPLAVAGGRLYFGADDGISGRELWAVPSLDTGCRPAGDRLCLGGGRFAVTVTWRDFSGRQGTGRTIPLTADTGGFWFFSPDNLELAVKVLDGRALNNAFWIFYAALSSVEYAITVTDTQTGLTRRYLNPDGWLASAGDTRGFGPLGAFSVQPPAVRRRTAAAAGCTPGPERLCLQGGRFAVEASWKDFAGHSGKGTAVALTPDTGAFWFFTADNLEVFTKLLDGQGVNGKFWFFYGALSNVEYTLTVTDTVTGAVRIYHNPTGRFASVGDIGAFQ